MKSFSVLLVLCERNSAETGGFPSQRPETRSFDILFDLCLNKRFSKQSRRRWFKTASRPLSRHCNATQNSSLQKSERAQMLLQRYEYLLGTRCSTFYANILNVNFAEYQDWFYHHCSGIAPYKIHKVSRCCLQRYKYLPGTIAQIVIYALRTLQ